MSRHQVTVLHVGGATAVVEVGGLRIILDPTFDAAQEYFGHYTEGLHGVIRTQGPALQPDEVGKIDVALISHDHHIDNLDYTGRDFIKSVPRVYTTPLGALRLRGQAKGLGDYQSETLDLPGGGHVRITAVPAHHGPDGVWQAIGPVTGFVLTGDLPSTYWSGDNSDVPSLPTSRETLMTEEVLSLGGENGVCDGVGDQRRCRGSGDPGSRRRAGPPDPRAWRVGGGA